MIHRRANPNAPTQNMDPRINKNRHSEQQTEVVEREEREG